MIATTGTFKVEERSTASATVDTIAVRKRKLSVSIQETLHREETLLRVVE